MTLPELVDGLRRAVAPLDPIGLDEIPPEAELQVRVDRKYVVDPATAAELLHAFGYRVRVVEIGGERCLGYESVYFDTPERLLFRQAAKGAPWRSKVRTRRYSTDGTCMLEVKARTRTGATAKIRRPHPAAGLRHLDAGDLCFVAANLARPVPLGALAPALETTYHRCTLIDEDADTRFTVDAAVRCALPDGPSVAIGSHLIVESKTLGPPAAVDRWLWWRGVRPVSLSKFCVGLASLEHGLPANRWARPIRRYVSAAANVM